MKVTCTIDAEQCEGTGFCAKIAPRRFELLKGVSHLRPGEPGDDELELLRDAESMCPTGAIVVRVEP